MAPDRVGFADGSGYLLGMDVFHQLHCLNYLRKKTILYNDIYPESAVDEIPANIHIRKQALCLFIFYQFSAGSLIDIICSPLY